MKVKGCSEGTLHKLWRKAVLSNNNHKCFKCGVTGYSEETKEDVNLVCHHIIRRKHVVTRWWYQNGMALCVECHKWAHANPLKEKEFVYNNWEYYDFLKEHENLVYPQYLMDNNLSHKEFRENNKQVLQEVIKNVF